MLPLSRDEVVHGKNPFSTACRATRGKFANLRAYCGWMFAFRANCCLWAASSRQGREWNHDTSLDWHLLEGADSWHHGVQQLVRNLT